MDKKPSELRERQYIKLLNGDAGKNLVFGLLTFLRRHLVALAFISLFVLVVFGGYLGWRYYQYRQSDFFAFDSFSSALNPPRAEQLAKLVDFNTLSEHLAQAIARDYAFLKQGPNQLRDLKNMIQAQLLQRVMSKEEPVAEKQDAQKLLQLPLAVLPADFLTQFSKNLVVQAPRDDSGEREVMLGTRIEHPMLGRAFPVVLRMENNGGDWIIRDIANADELVEQFREAQLKRMAARRDGLLHKRKETSERMNGIIPLQSCSAGLERLSDGSTLLLVANVFGKNIASLTVNNTNLEVIFSSESGGELLRRYLNSAQPVKPGEVYDRHWTIEFDLQDPLAQRVLNAGQIVCSASWRSMGLVNGEVLHAPDPPEMEEDFK
ncbi:MAG: translation initiation factor IF-2 [Desulfovibrio sp.]|nr:translation initiation factor IF-2 [Desulfovibrio sp.]